MHPTSLSIDELLALCTVKRTRASGPGGQHRNKVETAIVITHLPSGVVGQASEERSQHRNKEVAIKRLRANLAIEVRQDRDESDIPSELWRSRLKGKKIVVSQEHFDFATLLAEALDITALFGFDMKTAAEKLGVSTSQLIKLIKTNNNAIRWVNQNRHQRDLHRLT